MLYYKTLASLYLPYDRQAKPELVLQTAIQIAFINYSAIQIVTRFLSFSENGCTRAPLES